MKKIAIILAIAIAGYLSASAQKFALVDMEYILKNVPSYEMANEQLNQVSQRWEKEVTELAKEAETMYNNYKSEMVFLTDEQKKKREEEIVTKEKEVTDLKYKYFGPEGELYKKRQSLMKPIQEEVYNAVKKVSEEISNIEVSAIMTRTVLTTTPDTTIMEVLKAMIEMKVNRVPVVEKGVVIGIISRGDIIFALYKRKV